MSNYSKGRNLEYAAKKKLEDLGFMVFRCASSKPVDLVAVREGCVMLVECKTGVKPHISREDLAKTLALAGKAGGKAVVCLRRKFHSLYFYEILPSFEKKDLFL